MGRTDFSKPFRKIIICYKPFGYNLNVMRQSACLVFKPIMVNNHASLFNCTHLHKPNLISSRHIEGDNSTETDTKTSKHREPNQKYRLEMVSNVVMLGIIHTCTALRYKPAFIVTRQSVGCGC